MKVVLVGVNSKFIHSNLAIRYLKAYTNDLDYECDTLEFSINDLRDRVLKKILEQKADVIGFSCYIWNIEFIKQLVNTIKLINPKTIIFVGGPEVSFQPENFLKQNNVDFLIKGEGEETFREFIQNILNNNFQDKIFNNAKNIKGLYTKVDGEIYYGGFRENMDINNIVFPYKEEDDLKNKIVYYEASRGCPFRCKYCLSSVDRKVRFLDIERVKDELKFFINKKVKLVKFVDRTFNCNAKFAKEIWKFIVEQGEDVETTFHFEISADLLKKEQIDVLNNCSNGRIQFEVGVQTTNDEVLRNINRYVNFKDIKDKVLEIESLRNIKQHLDLIAGLPGENLQSFKKSFDEVYCIKPEELQLGFLKLLEGSPMIEEVEKWGMVYSPYPPYEILKTNHISYEEIVQLKKIEKLVDKYYNSNKFNTILKYFEIYYSSSFEFYNDLSNFCDKRGYFDRSLSGVDYYKVFLEFNNCILKESNDALNEIIKYDYLLHNKKKWLPNFLNRDFDKKFNKLIRDTVSMDEYYDNKPFHVEKFYIDIFNFLHIGKIKFKDSYIIFEENNINNIKDITGLVKKISIHENI